MSAYWQSYSPLQVFLTVSLPTSSPSFGNVTWTVSFSATKNFSIRFFTLFQGHVTIVMLYIWKTLSSFKGRIHTDWCVRVCVYARVRIFVCVYPSFLISHSLSVCVCVCLWSYRGIRVYHIFMKCFLFVPHFECQGWSSIFWNNNILDYNILLVRC